MPAQYLGRFVIFSFILLAASGCQKKEAALDPGLGTGICAHNLQILAQGKKLWAENNHKTADDTPTMDELGMFIRHTPVCPAAGAYTLGKVSDLPTCSIAAHNEAFKKLAANP